MDKTTINNVYTSQKFRTPIASEQDLGLWVDRIGSERRTFSAVPARLRLLGLYGAVFVEKGEGYLVNSSERAQKVGAGNVMLLFPDVPHAYYPENVWTTQWIVWGGPESETLHTSGYLSQDCPVVEDRGEAFARAFADLSRIISLEHTEAVLRRKTVLLNMILDLYSLICSRGAGKRNREKMERAVDIIRKGALEHVCIPDIASRLSMSTSHFRRLFKQYTGRSPLQYHIQFRISCAKQLLAEGQSIKETAADTGYEDVFYFMRVFKKYTGISPGRFAHRERHEPDI